jgi:hypothetical protein
MPQRAAGECAPLLTHLVVLRPEVAPRHELSWYARWRNLLAPWLDPARVPSAARLVVDAAAIPPRLPLPLGPTHLIVQELSTQPCGFQVTEEYLSGATVREPSLVASEDALLREAEWLAFRAATARSVYPLVLHAGAVSRDGLALVFPAVSSAGKTTLTYGLEPCGWLPLCDDICPLQERADGTFVAVGCPRCGHLSPRSEALLCAAGVDLEGPVAGLQGYFRPTQWGAPASVRAIVVPRFQEGAALCVEALTQAEGAVALYGATFQRERVSRHAEWVAALRLATRVPAVSLTYGSLDSALAGIDTITHALFGECAQATNAGHVVEEAVEHG